MDEPRWRRAIPDSEPASACRQDYGLQDEDALGRRVPSTALECCQGGTLDLQALCLGFPVVALYFYPGAERSPDGGDGTLLADAAEHRAFHVCLDDFVARSYRPVGISSESIRDQRASIAAHGLQHQLLCDHDLRIAAELNLPTFELEGVEHYRRLTLIAVRGVITKVFFPVADAGRSASQVLGWLQVHGF
jgi:peroxiredoxin